MNIDRVARMGNSGYEPKKTPSVTKSEGSSLTDNVSISDEAKQMAFEARLRADVQTIAKQILAQPEEESRLEKLKSVKEKLKNGEYDNLSPEVLAKISDRITEVFLG